MEPHRTYIPANTGELVQGEARVSGQGDRWIERTTIACVAEWASDLARDVLQDRLRRRWAHTECVAVKVRRLAPLLGADAELVEAACWLHDVEYVPSLHNSGFHPLDGARHLRDIALAWRPQASLVSFSASLTKRCAGQADLDSRHPDGSPIAVV